MAATPGRGLGTARAMAARVQRLAVIEARNLAKVYRMGEVDVHARVRDGTVVTEAR